MFHCKLPLPPNRTCSMFLLPATHGWERPFVPCMSGLVWAQTLLYPSAAPCHCLLSPRQKIAQASCPAASLSAGAKQCHLSARTQVKKPGSRHRWTITTTSCVCYQGYSQVWCGWLAAKSFIIITSYVYAVQAARSSATYCRHKRGKS